MHEIYKTTLTQGYAYHQRFDGLTEAMNKVLEEVIRCSINYTQTNWLDLLPEATAAINNSVDPNTNKSANNVYLGRRLFLPVDLAHGLVDAIPTVKDFLLEVEAVRHLAAEGVRKAIVRYTSDFNKHASLNIDPRLKIGAKVMLKAHNIIQPGHHQRKGQKLQDKNLGVFEIVDTVGRTGFRLNMPGYKVHPEFGADSLIPVETGLDEFEVRAAEPIPDHFIDQTAFYEVDHLSARRLNKYKPEYFVMYKGYGVADGEWMSESILIQDCPDLVNKYRAKYLKLDNNNQPYWSDPVGVKNTKVNIVKPAVNGRGRGRGRGKGRGSGRSRGKRGPGRPRKQPIYASQVDLKPTTGPVKPVKPKTVAKPKRRSRRLAKPAVSAVYASDLPEFTRGESDSGMDATPDRLAHSDAKW